MSVHWGGKGPGHVSRWPRGVGAISPYSGATMLLDFLNPVLDPRITFSRGTNATLIDSTGRLTYAPNNLVQRSQELQDVYWVKLAVTATGDVTTAPDGTTTADKVVATASAFTRRLLYANASLSVSTNIFSFYAKASEYSLVRAVDSAGGSRWFASFDVSNGTVVGGTTGGAQFVSAGISFAGNGWYRCWVVFNATSASGAIGMVGYPAGATLDQFGVQYAGDGTSGTFFWGLQLEQVTYQTTPSAYTVTTSALYYGPRFDYDPVTLAPRGLLIEEARTNSITYSDDWSNAAWSKGGLTISANATASPDGTANADKLAEDTSVGTHGVTSALVTKAAVATTYTYSIYVKAAERTAVQLRIADAAASANRVICDANLATQTVTTSVGGTFTNASATITNAANGWFRVTLTGTTSTETGLFCIAFLANPAGTISYTGVTGSGAYLYGAQLEAGSFATSYIPTVASTVTRNADVATMTGTNFSSWFNQTEGTFVADVLDNAAGVNVLVASDGTTTNQLIMASSTLNIFSVFTGGVFQAQLGVTPPAPYKTAGAYRVNDFAAVANGGTVSTDTSGTLATYSRLSIGTNAVGNAAFLNGHIRTIAYFNTRLPNAQLQTLTAPSLATTLSLDFTTGSYNVGF